MKKNIRKYLEIAFAYISVGIIFGAFFVLMAYITNRDKFFK